MSFLQKGPLLQLGDPKTSGTLKLLVDILAAVLLFLRKHLQGVGFSLGSLTPDSGIAFFFGMLHFRMKYSTNVLGVLS